MNQRFNMIACADDACSEKKEGEEEEDLEQKFISFNL